MDITGCHYPPIAPDRMREEHELPALSGVSADAANGFWPRQPTERTFLLLGSLT